ncbi:MAG: DUF721 domain-containing protein [Desulfuromonadales bacterium]|nr:DUF721 domain-containing protein [Desulfuromonadales bacterium]
MKPKRPRMRFPKPLSDLLQDGLAVCGLGERLREIDVWRFWSEVVGPVVASRAQPVRIINGTLTVAVSSGPWMQELSFLKGMMKDKLNARLGSELVKDIILRSGRVATKEDLLADELPPKKRLTPRQLAFISEQSATIADPETREAFAALMKASLESSFAPADDSPLQLTQQEKK